MNGMIELRSITVHYPNGVTALDEVSLTFAAGQFTVLLGPSGAGKSTLLRCLNGLVRPSRGTIRADDLGLLFPSGPMRATAGAPA